MVVNVYVSAVTQDNVSRHELLSWVNNLLQSSLTKIEEMSHGTAYCQLTHILFPQGINLKKVKWTARNDIDYLANWKVLVQSWKEIGIDKPVDVQRLMKAKFQDNYEFLQWFYKFFNHNWDESEYDALAIRGGEPMPFGGKPLAQKTAAPARLPVKKPTTATTIRSTATSAPKTVSVTKAPAAATTAPESASAGPDANSERIRALELQFEELNTAYAAVETERDFYYAALQRVEQLAQGAEGGVISAAVILSTLYGEDGNENDEPKENAIGVDATEVIQRLEHAAVVDDEEETF